MKLLNKVDLIDQKIIKKFDFQLSNRIKCY